MTDQPGPETLWALIAIGPWCQTEVLKPYAAAWEADRKQLEGIETAIRIVKAENEAFLAADRADGDGAGCEIIHEAVIRTCDIVLASLPPSGSET